MAYHEFSLNGLNSERVEALWSFNPGKAAVHRVLPDGRMDLLARFDVRDGGSISNVRLLIAGPAQRPSLLPTRGDTALLGVRFRVGWGGVCLGIDPSTIRDRVLLADDAQRLLGVLAVPILMSRTDEELRDTLRRAVEILTNRATRLARQQPVLDAIAMVHQTGGCLSFGALAKLTDTNERTLRRGMLDAVGLPAKTLSLIVRFQRTLGLLRRVPNDSLTQIALEGGYSDQAHMTREFRRLGGFTPAMRPELPSIHLAML
ncbi:AraC family transcriptional regulator [Rhodoferax sp. UBA5149]|uniref:AraC family transcriptional regulator n=1 Tax=Rhodoferax sp. UBA5149 TaxID=1947379 RepID=UPI0025E9A077|nr:helix-turn-helix domain-containing protein [Rhodoferax sp. UBA5149]